MIELNNIDFKSLERTCKLSESNYNNLWQRVSHHDTVAKVVVESFELGASLTHKNNEKKVCALLKPT